MPFNFEKLDIWKLAIEFADEVHLVTHKFPKEEMFSLTSQFKRAADSVSLNIVEGSIGHQMPNKRNLSGILFVPWPNVLIVSTFPKEENILLMKISPFFINGLKNFLLK